MGVRFLVLVTAAIFIFTAEVRADWRSTWISSCSSICQQGGGEAMLCTRKCDCVLSESESVFSYETLVSPTASPQQQQQMKQIAEACARRVSQ
jgi:hypothetical protein